MTTTMAELAPHFLEFNQQVGAAIDLFQQMGKTLDVLYHKCIFSSPEVSQVGGPRGPPPDGGAEHHGRKVKDKAAEAMTAAEKRKAAKAPPPSKAPQAKQKPPKHPGTEVRQSATPKAKGVPLPATPKLHGAGVPPPATPKVPGTPATPRQTGPEVWLPGTPKLLSSGIPAPVTPAVPPQLPSTPVPQPGAVDRGRGKKREPRLPGPTKLAAGAATKRHKARSRSRSVEPPPVDSTDVDNLLAELEDDLLADIAAAPEQPQAPAEKKAKQPATLPKEAKNAGGDVDDLLAELEDDLLAGLEDDPPEPVQKSAPLPAHELVSPGTLPHALGPAKGTKGGSGSTLAKQRAPSEEETSKQRTPSEEETTTCPPSSWLTDATAAEEEDEKLVLIKPVHSNSLGKPIVSREPQFLSIEEHRWLWHLRNREENQSTSASSTTKGSSPRADVQAKPPQTLRPWSSWRDFGSLAKPASGQESDKTEEQALPPECMSASAQQSSITRMAENGAVSKASTAKVLDDHPQLVDGSKLQKMPASTQRDDEEEEDEEQEENEGTEAPKAQTGNATQQVNENQPTKKPVRMQQEEEEEEEAPKAMAIDHTHHVNGRNGLARRPGSSLARRSQEEEGDEEEEEQDHESKKAGQAPTDVKARIPKRRTSSSTKKAEWMSKMYGSAGSTVTVRQRGKARGRGKGSGKGKGRRQPSEDEDQKLMADDPFALAFNHRFGDDLLEDVDEVIPSWAPV
mmetsp:Transcript_22590/g.41602  ORF Transcript_22590/g.41602 Transcript_22590/m.41602 type:complete len:737 (+) Transcript_22590:127-2337(+)